jgi:hypothetical protein
MEREVQVAREERKIKRDAADKNTYADKHLW